MSIESDDERSDSRVVNNILARNLRRFRSEIGASQADVARRAGLSKQTLSTLEQGLGNPTIDTIQALATALRVVPSQLMTGWGTRVYVQRAAEGTWAHSGGGTDRLLGQIYGTGNVRFEIRRMDGPRKDAQRFTGYSVGSLHHLYVIEGSVEAGPSTELYTLETGDFMRFSADLAHSFRCLSATAVLHLVTTLPMLPGDTPDL